MDLRKIDKLFFFERNFVTLDGLWMIETENETDWDTALKIDTIVWIKMLKTIVRRIKRYLKIDTNSLVDLVEILCFRWSVEGWDYVITKSDNELVIKIVSCPYKSSMDRNPERQDRIPRICNEMCRPFYVAVIKDFNPNIPFKRVKYMGMGDDCCDFWFSIDKGIKGESNTNNIRKSKRIVNNEDKLFYFERNFFTMDGLWIIECENEINWKSALKINIIVWERLYQIIFRRVKRYLEIKTNNLGDLIEVLSFVWSCEGYDYEVAKCDDSELIINITKCPYIDAMQRNSERHNRIKSICLDMCISFYEPALSDFNPKIQLMRDKYIGVGDHACNFHFKLKND